MTSSLPLERRLGEQADVIVGDDCGAQQAPCAGQGLPAAQLIDATPRRADASDQAEDPEAVAF